MCAFELCQNNIKPQKKFEMSHVAWDAGKMLAWASQDVEILGRPQQIKTEAGEAITFNGIDDGLIMNVLPLAMIKEFTIEAIIQPYAGGQPEQRFLHLQEDDTSNRILLETRLISDNRWYFDTYIQTPKGDCCLESPECLHETGLWYSVALTYDGESMRHYVNAIEEAAGKVEFCCLAAGRTSVGVRMNRMFWFKGAIATVKFTKGVVEPCRFLKPYGKAIAE
jgi:hypothetical protein